MKERIKPTPSAFDGLRPEIQLEVLRRIYGEPPKPLGIARITICCAVLWALAGIAFYIATK